MTNPNPKQEKQGRPLPLPLIVVVGILVLIGVIMLVSNKVQDQDPTLTAAPPTGTPGQQVHPASAGKLAYEQQMMMRQKAQMEAFKAANGAGSSGSQGQGAPGAVAPIPATH